MTTLREETQVYVGLDSIVRPNILASCMLAYIPVFGRITITGVDYARLLFALVGLADEDRSETERNPMPWVEEYRKILQSEIKSAASLSNPYSSALLIERASSLGYLNISPYYDWSEAFLSLAFSAEDRERLEQGKVLQLRPNFAEWDKFVVPLKHSAEGIAKMFEKTHRDTVTLHTDIMDSYIAGLGFSVTGRGMVSTCTPGFWRWVRRSSNGVSSAQLDTTQIANLVESAPDRFTVDDLFRFVDNGPALDELLSVKERYDKQIRRVRDLGRESFLLLVQEVAGAVAAPFVTAFEIMRMICRIDFSRWRRRP